MTRDNPPTPQETHQEPRIGSVEAKPRPLSGLRRTFDKFVSYKDEIDSKLSSLTRTSSRALSPDPGQGSSSHTSPEANPSQTPNLDTVKEVRTSSEIIPDGTQRTQDNPSSPQETYRERQIHADDKLIKAKPGMPSGLLPKFLKPARKEDENDSRSASMTHSPSRAQSPVSNDPGQGSSSHTSLEANPSQAPNLVTVEGGRKSLKIIPAATQRTQDDPSSPQETSRGRQIRADLELVEAKPGPLSGLRRTVSRLVSNRDENDSRSQPVIQSPSRARSPVSNDPGQGSSSHTSFEANPSQAPNLATVEEVPTPLKIIPTATQRTQDDPSSPQETYLERQIRADLELVEGDAEPRLKFRQRHTFIRKLLQNVEIDPRRADSPSRVRKLTSNDPGQGSSSHTSPEGNPGHAPILATVEGVRTEIILDATQSSAGTSHVPGISQSTASAISNLQPTLDTTDVFSKPLKTLRDFNLFVDETPNTRHGGKVVLSVFACASKIILDQADFQANTILVDLLKKVSEVFVFMMGNRRVAKISSMPALYGRLARQTLECADFIVHYSEIKNTLKQDSIQRYSKVLDDLMLQFGRVNCGTALNVHHISEDLGFADLAYVNGAGWETSKRCLPGTRAGILSEIKDWVDDTGENVPRVLWLYGTAGKGKSAVAHTIASWFDERSGPGACFCFDRKRQAERRHEKIFTTIARDLADSDPIIRRALARALHDDDELRHTTDITRQWEKFLLGPLDAISKAVDAPVLIVIDGLDESGDAHFQEQILRMLVSTPLKPLPKNSRIIVTSRPLEDIANALLTASHVRRISMDDIPNVSTECDIQRYISTRLTFDDEDIERLAQKSDGLFKWAQLACEYVIDTNKVVGATPMKRFKDLLVGPPEEIPLLDTMYHHILTDIIPEDEHAVTMFRSVMGQILASLESLSMAALTSMRLCFPREDDRYDVKSVIGKLGSLFTGTTDSHTPIRPVHASFYNFLTDESRSDKFFVDMSSVQRDLAFASLRVMEHGLRFNICSLESSYLPNAAVRDLEERVKNCVPAELSYSCRLWGTHARAISFDPLLIKEVKAFLNEERLLFWLEALALMKDLNSSIGTLSSVAVWLKGHDEHADIFDVVVDTRRFVQIFAPAILYSTPHLYLSALPFAPSQSQIFKTFFSKFPRTPQIVAGHVVKWPQMANILFATSPSPVNDIAISPDGTCIACGSDDGKVQVWHTGTGEAFLTLQGHTGPVLSVAFSPDGKKIMSGSDETIQVWDTQTGVPSRLLRGHTDRILSIAISPDGTHVVSGSADNTIRVWSVESDEASLVLQGHSDVVYSIAISPDGSHIISSSADRTIRMWDAITGDVLIILQGHTDRVHSIAISPDGTYIMSGSSDETIRVWDTIMGQALGMPLQGHTGRILSVAISPDGTCMASGSDDMTVRVWDAETGEALGVPLRGHTDYVRCIAISPDSSYVVSGSDDKTIRMWDLHPAVCSTANLTHALRSAFSFPQESTSLTPNEEGWVVGPDGQLLMWIPIHSHLILSDSWEMDLSCFEHGESWDKCHQ